MKNDKLMPGLILVLIGTVFLLNNFGIIDFHWGNLIHLWPVFLVIGGVNLVFAHNRSPWATILKVAVVIAGFALIVFGRFSNRNGWWPVYYYNSNNDDNNNDDNNDDSDSSSNVKNGTVNIGSNDTFNEPYNTSAKVARLNISGGGTTYNLNETTDQLFSARTSNLMGKYEFTRHQEDSVYVMDFSMKNNKGHFNWGSDNHKANSADIKLNPNPEWEINVETGATKLDFDLSKFKVRNLKLSGGAASFTVKLGQPLQATNLNISTGVSDVNVSIPENAACSVETDSGLSSTSFDGFNKKEDGHYETSNFESAKNKIYIHISGGLSDFKVKRY